MNAFTKNIPIKNTLNFCEVRAMNLYKLLLKTRRDTIILASIKYSTYTYYTLHGINTGICITVVFRIEMKRIFWHFKMWPTCSECKKFCSSTVPVQSTVYFICLRAHFVDKTYINILHFKEISYYISTALTVTDINRTNWLCKYHRHIYNIPLVLNKYLFYFYKNVYILFNITSVIFP